MTDSGSSSSPLSGCLSSQTSGCVHNAAATLAAASSLGFKPVIVVICSRLSGSTILSPGLCVRLLGSHTCLSPPLLTIGMCSLSASSLPFTGCFSALRDFLALLPAIVGSPQGSLSPCILVALQLPQSEHQMSGSLDHILWFGPKSSGVVSISFKRQPLHLSFRLPMLLVHVLHLSQAHL